MKNFFPKFGFTLIELLVVITIIAIITLIAVPSYFAYLTKSRRSDAINTLMAISLSQERYRSNNATYGTLAQVWPNTTSQQGYYTLSVTGNTATAYTITATGTGSQGNDTESGTSCATMSLTESSGTITQTPAACWPS